MVIKDTYKFILIILIVFFIFKFLGFKVSRKSPQIIEKIDSVKVVKYIKGDTKEYIKKVPTLIYVDTSQKYVTLLKDLQAKYNKKVDSIK